MGCFEWMFYGYFIGLKMHHGHLEEKREEIPNIKCQEEITTDRLGDSFYVSRRIVLEKPLFLNY